MFLFLNKSIHQWQSSLSGRHRKRWILWGERSSQRPALLSESSPLRPSESRKSRVNQHTSIFIHRFYMFTESLPLCLNEGWRPASLWGTTPTLSHGNATWRDSRRILRRTGGPKLGLKLGNDKTHTRARWERRQFGLNCDPIVWKVNCDDDGSTFS